MNCKFCGKAGLRWVKERGELMLLDRTDTRHTNAECRAMQKEQARRMQEREQELLARKKRQKPIVRKMPCDVPDPEKRLAQMAREIAGRTE